jgi:CubicO group peptidase (beta-lactamase class C family)
MLNLLILATLAVSLLATPPLRAAVPPPVLSTEIQRALQQQQLTGAVWATVRPEGAATGAAGLAHAGNGTRMRADAKVQVGSVGKTLVAAGVLRLITEGHFTLDTPVAALLPALAFSNRWSDSHPVRVRHLLAHTAGLENFRLWQVFSLDAHAGTPLSEAFTRDPSLLTVQARPGSRYAYSCLGYGLLGMIIEAVSGQRWDNYLDAQLLRPLGMRDSTFGFVTQTGPQADARLAMGHFEKGAMQAATRNYLPSASQLTTTAADMVRAAAFLMGDGSIAGRPFIDPALMAALGVPEGTEAVRAGLTTGHGLALSGRDRHGQFGYCHPGTTVGFNAMLCLYPRHRKAFFIAANADSESADYEHLNKLLLDALELPPPATTAARTAPAADIAQWQGIYVPAPHGMASLAWTDIVMNFISVKWDGGILRLTPFQGKEKIPRPAGGHLFTMADRLGNTHALLIGDDGQRIVTDGLHSHRQIGMPLFAALWASLAAGLLGLGYIVIAGGWRLLRGGPRQPLSIPLMGVAALVLPVPLFFLQSFLRMGELTIASGVLAVVTAILPVALAAGLFQQWRGKRRRVADTLALAAALQCTLVLAAWGMLPLLLWK